MSLEQSKLANFVVLFFLTLLIISLAWWIWYGWHTVNGATYDNKTCVLTVTKNELAYCYFGDSESPVTVNNYIELKSKGEIIDDMLQFLMQGKFD